MKTIVLASIILLGQGSLSLSLKDLAPPLELETSKPVRFERDFVVILPKNFSDDNTTQYCHGLDSDLSNNTRSAAQVFGCKMLIDWKPFVFGALRSDTKDIGAAYQEFYSDMFKEDALVRMIKDGCFKVSQSPTQEQASTHFTNQQSYLDLVRHQTNIETGGDAKYLWVSVSASYSRQASSSQQMQSQT
eukprot:CAMPEP_0203746600 /NCGR_PEP_ID=MMETSP0098-20131031/1999_1 /ASSEMBLY_ACC=CAM_ASM_000208 /TAXON_ID=96639 /ORGANISM=" , Strain NY0313808BC1" /LENGTH=188 /DNA_ID=CAMNT_0050634757 /DNA_START=1532 /DNA_END=2094 /DNA_ORIENTATION=+